MRRKEEREEETKNRCRLLGLSVGSDRDLLVGICFVLHGRLLHLFGTDKT